MRKTSQITALLAALFTLILTVSACGSPASAPSSTNAAGNPASNAPADTKAAATPAPQAASSSNALKYYKAVTLGMTKAEVAQATGLAAKEAKGEYDPEGAFNYTDSEGYGVYVLFNKSDKAYSKTVLKKGFAKDIAPLTAKPVTEALCDQIKKGMSKEDVVKLLGGEGVELSTTATKIETVENVGPILYWANGDGSFIQVVFLADGTVANAMYRD